MLVPAAVLVLVVLGSLAVDAAVVFHAQRELSNRTAAASNDIAGLAVSDDAFYRGDGVVLEQEQADAFIDLVFAADQVPGGFASWEARATTSGPSVTVDAVAEVRYVFARAIPGARDTATVRARSAAEAVGN